MRLINVTGRDLNIYDKDGKEIVTTILSEGAATVQVSRTGVWKSRRLRSSPYRVRGDRRTPRTKGWNNLYCEFFRA